MDGRTHHAVAVATYEDLQGKLDGTPLGHAMGYLQPEEWQLYTVIPDRVDGDNVVSGYFHSHKFAFDAAGQQPVTITVDGQQRPKYLKGSAHPIILSYYVNIRNRHREGDELEVRQLAARASHYIIDGMTTIWHLWQGKLSDSMHQKEEHALGGEIKDLLTRTAAAKPGTFSQGNMFREIARRTETFFDAWLPKAVAAAQGGTTIAGSSDAVRMIQDVKDNLASIWLFIAEHMGEDDTKAGVAKRLNLPPSGPVPETALDAMTAEERALFQ